MPKEKKTEDNAPRLLIHAVDWLMRRRIALLLFCVVTVAIALGPSLHLKFDRSVEGLFQRDDPRLVNYREDKALFGGAETALVAYDDPQLLTSLGLARLESFDASLNELKGVESVISLSRVRLPSAPLKTKSLRQQLESGDVSENQLREELLACDLYRNRLLSADGKTTVMLVALAPAGKENASRRQVIAQIRQLCAAHDPPAVLAGGPILIEDVYSHLEQDGRTLGIASSLVLALVIAVLFRNLRWILLPLLVVHVTLVWTKALLVVSGMQLSMVSSPLVALVTVIGVTTAIHMAVRFREERIGIDPGDAMRRTLIHIGPAVFWTCLTTAVGFFALLVSRIVPVAGFGTMMGLGSSLVFVAAMGLIPAGVLLGRFHTDPGRAPGEKVVTAVLGNIVHVVERYPWRVVAFGIGLLGLTLLGIFRLEVATDFDENFRHSSPIVKSYRFITDRMGTAAMVDVLIDTPDPTRPKEINAFLESMRALQQDLAEIQGVQGSISTVNILDFVGGTKKQKKQGTALEKLLAGRLEALTPAQRLTALRTLQPNAIAGFWNSDKRVARIVIQMGNLRGAKAKRQLFETIENVARRRFPPARTASVDILLSYLVKSMLADQWITFSVAVAAILTMLMFAFRDWRLGLLALFPNAAPILIVVGAMGWLDLKVNVATAMLASVSMGLTVDFSIHYLYRFQYELRAGKSFSTALQDAHRSVGLAMVFANLALVAGFSTLMLSSFVPTIHFGILISFATLGGLLGNLIALPLLLRLLPGFGSRGKGEKEK